MFILLPFYQAFPVATPLLHVSLSDYIQLKTFCL